MQKALRKIAAVVRSNNFFYAVMALFVLQAVWIAVSVVYPQPFDENTHFALIQLYSHHLSPFLNSQPPSADVLGVVTRDPSYLYHYLLSFPYRIFAHWVHDVPAQIIFLRAFNIAFFTAGLLVFRKVLQKTQASSGLINTTLLFFILIPVVPFLAGQLNYDNLLMPVAAVTLLLGIKFAEHLESEHRIDIVLGTSVFSVAMLGCLIKSEFLPIFMAVSVFMAYKLISFALSKGRFLLTLSKEFLPKRRRATTIATVSFLAVFGLFFQRYGVNLVSYGTPVPRCEQILSVSRCSADGTWKRSHDAKLSPKPAENPVRYSVSWSIRMFITSFYARSGGNTRAYYVNVNPLPVIAVAAIVVFLCGMVLFVRYVREILKEHSTLIFLLFVSVVYVAVLWAHLYRGHLQNGEKFGINGRYLFPVILPVLLSLGLAFQKLLAKRMLIKPALFVVVLVMFLQGGGILTFVVGSNRYWYWDNRYIYMLNNDTQKIVKPIIIKSLPGQAALKDKILRKWHGE